MTLVISGSICSGNSIRHRILTGTCELLETEKLQPHDFSSLVDFRGDTRRGKQEQSSLYRTFRRRKSSAQELDRSEPHTISALDTESRDATVRIEAIRCDLRLEDVYAKV